jgi:hypothetical protein
MHQTPLSATLTLFIVALASFVQAGTVTVEGTYQGKNVYVQNPFVNNGVGFCVFEVSVNDKPTTDEVNSSSFEIDLTALKLTMGEKVVIKLKHKDDCKPKIINPEVLKVRSTFEIVAGSAKVNKDGTFSFTTKGETGKLPFTVEQYRWNKWVKVEDVEGKGRMEGAFYSIKYQPHSGENKIRIKQVDASGPRYSEPVKYRSTSPEIKFENKDKVEIAISFSDVTRYEIYDIYGNLMAKGSAVEVDVSNLKKGTYYINYDNKAGEKFVKR